MVTGRPMFPGSTVKEELHLIFRLLGESSAVSLVPTRGQWLTAGAVTSRAEPPAKPLPRRGQAWAGAPGWRSAEVMARVSLPTAPWDAWAGESHVLSPGQDEGSRVCLGSSHPTR